MEPNKDKQKDDNKPIIPTLKDSAGKPQLKIKGIAQGGMSLIERLKQFKKKDLAFIMAGLGVLFMAPLAEHFMMAPEGQNGDLFGPGISSRGNGSAFGGGTSSPYETGGSSMAPGSALGGNGDVITPLNVRDPSALVMGPGASQQPPAGSPSAPTPPPDKKESGDWKDALANAGATAGRAATKAAGLPVPKPSLGSSALRGMGALGGGGSGGGFNALGAPSAANVPNRGGGGSNMPGVRGGNFKGVARGPGDGAGGGLDALKKAAGQQGSDFNRSGVSGAASLDQAASRNMNADQSNGGANDGNMGSDKGPGGNQGKDSKSVGESLEFLRQKAEQDHAIDLEWKLKEKAAMRIPNLEDKILEEAVMTPFKAITAGIAKQITDFGKGGGGSLACTDTNGNQFVLSKGDIADTCLASTGGSEKTTPSSFGFCNKEAGDQVCQCTGGMGTAIKCGGTKDNTPPKNTSDKGQGNNGGQPVPANGTGGTTPTSKPDGTVGSSNQLCTDYKNTIGSNASKKPAATPASGQPAASFQAQPGESDAATNQAKAVAEVNAANAALTGTPANVGGCAGQSAKANSQTRSVQDLLTDVRDHMYGKTAGDYATSTLGLVDTESNATLAVLKQLKDGKKSGALVTADTNIQAGDATADTITAEYGNEDKALTATQEPLGKLNAAVTKAGGDKGDTVLTTAINDAEKNLDLATKGLKDATEGIAAARKDAGTFMIPDADTSKYYTQAKKTIGDDATSADKIAQQYDGVIKLEKAAVDALRDQLAPKTPPKEGDPGVPQNARNTQALVNKDGSGDTAKPNVSDLVKAAKTWATPPDPDNKNKTAYQTASKIVMPNVTTASDNQDQEANGDGAKNLGIVGVKTKLRDASTSLNGEAPK